jgi:hypothetical protein
MRVVVISRDATDYARSVEEWLREFQRRTGRELEVINPDSAAGISFCTAYDIVEYPSVIALTDDGVMQQLWAGTQLPTISEVSYYG